MGAPVEDPDAEEDQKDHAALDDDDIALLKTYVCSPLQCRECLMPRSDGFGAMAICVSRGR